LRRHLIDGIVAAAIKGSERKRRDGMGLMEVLGLKSSGATASPPAGAMASPAPGALAAPGPQDDKLDAARTKYEDAKLALEQGDLARVPAKAPPGVEGPFAAVTAARKALPAAPATLKDYEAGSKALATLEKRVAAYLAAEAAALARLKKKYDADKAALDAELLQVPHGAPMGLNAAFDAVTAAQAAIPAYPATIEEYVAAIKGWPALKKSVNAFLKAVARKKRIDDGVGAFGASGSRLAELKDSDKLNDEQKRILDEKLTAKLGAPGVRMSEKELKAFAQRVVEKTNKLAETPLEKKIPGVNEKLAKSETLKTNIVKLQAAKWKIKVNKKGGGSYCDKTNKTIAIDPDDPIEEVLGGLAHETGHALYTPPAAPTIKASASGVDYVRQSTEVNFLDEGEAQLVACRAATDLGAQGVTANVPADGAGKFMAIYLRYSVGDIDEDTARKEMAKEFGNLITSTTKESYLVYYGSAHIANWNAAHKKDASKQLDKSILATMTLFP
jgi:hypothetical protein